jgi:predicted O-methyltransferase YrrM
VRFIQCAKCKTSYEGCCSKVCRELSSYSPFIIVTVHQLYLLNAHAIVPCSALNWLFCPTEQACARSFAAATTSSACAIQPQQQQYQQKALLSRATQRRTVQRGSDGAELQAAAAVGPFGASESERIYPAMFQHHAVSQQSSEVGVNSYGSNNCESGSDENMFVANAGAGAGAVASSLRSAVKEPSLLSVPVSALSEYCHRHSSLEPLALQLLREETLTAYASSPGAARMLSDPLQGRILTLLAAVSGAKRGLELGTFTGYSALSLALGMSRALSSQPEDAARASLITCDTDPHATAIARRHFDSSGLGDAIDFRHQSAASLLAELCAEQIASPAFSGFDIVFLDADKKQYKEYLLTLLGEGGSSSTAAAGEPLLQDGALILVDNTLWKGHVLKKVQELAWMIAFDLILSGFKCLFCTLIRLLYSQHPDLAAYAPADALMLSNHMTNDHRQNDQGNTKRNKIKSRSKRSESVTDSMHEFNCFVAAHPKLQPLMLPLRDGLTVIRYQK